MWNKLVDIIPAVAQHPLALFAYVLLLISWVAFTFKKRNTQTFLEALEIMPDEDKAQFAKDGGYAYNELTGLNREQRYSLIVRRYRYFRLFGIIITVFILIALLVHEFVGAANSAKKIGDIEKEQKALSEKLESNWREQSLLTVRVATSVGQLSLSSDPEVQQLAARLGQSIENFLKSDPQLSLHERVSINLAKATLANARSDFAESIRLLGDEQVQKQIGSTAMILKLQGDSYFGSRRWQDALNSYNKVLALDSNDRESVARAGTCEIEMEAYGAAVIRYKSAVAAFPAKSSESDLAWHAAIHNNMGYGLAHEDKNEEATVEFKEAITCLQKMKQDRSSMIYLASIYANLAQLSYRSNKQADGDASVEQIRRIIAEIDPKHTATGGLKELIDWLNQKNVPINKAKVANAHGDPQKCYLCHTGMSPPNTTPPK